MLIVVALIVVKYFVFSVITRDHGSFGGRHQVEILPTDLPELFKPARDLLEPRKFEILGPKFSRKPEKSYFLINFPGKNSLLVSLPLIPPLFMF